VVTLLIPHWMKTFDKTCAEVKRSLVDVVDMKGHVRYLPASSINKRGMTDTVSAL
jgi:hypothetical protein